MIDPRTGQVAFWISDTGIDGENAVERDQVDLIVIDRLPPYVWFQARPTLPRASATSRWPTPGPVLEGRGPFRRSKNQLYEHHSELISSWRALRDVRAQRRAVKWLLDQELIDDRAAEEFATRRPGPDLP